jgi:biopolymer transport protein ExbB/TolQ
MMELMSHSVFLWPVAACAVLSLLISIERLYFLFLPASIASEPFMKAIEVHVLVGDLDRAIQHCLGEPQAPLANVVKAALVHANDDREDLALAVEQATLDALPLVQRRTGYLATIANVVTLFGLLGTITGLIQSFDAVSHADVETRQSMLAGGIAMAMYATAGGIAVAIPTLAAYAILVEKGNSILDDVDRCAARVVMLLHTRKRAAATAPVEAPQA